MKVLLPVDSSHCSIIAVETVFSRAWKEDTEFLILCVDQPVYYEYAVPPSAACVTELSKAREEHQRDLHTLVADTAKKLSEKLGCPAQGKVSEGAVAETILRTAREWNADLIVIGSHSRRGLERLFLGSVAEEVARKAECSVEIVRSRKDAPCHHNPVII